MPTKPQWLLAVPDALTQLQALERETLTRRDIENLFGVSKARAWQLLRQFGAKRTGNLLTIGRGALIQALEKIEAGDTFQAEAERRENLYSTLRQARASRVRVRIAEPHGKERPSIEGLPEGVRLDTGRIEIRFETAKEGIERLYALAKALMNDYDRYEELVEPPPGGKSGDG